MSYRETEWRMRDDTRMFACEWLPEDPSRAKAFIGLVHGMGEHTRRYAHVAEMLVREGYIVWAFDQYGHGRTPGKRGHAPGYDALLQGPDLLIAEASRRYPDLPAFLYGHSMGGNVTLNYLLRRQPTIAGAVVSSPWLKLAFSPPPLTALVGRIVERIYPQYSNHRPLVAERLTSDPAMIRRIAEDPDGHGYITAGFFYGVSRAGHWAIANAGKLSVPVLLMHGSDDKVTSLEASRQFAARAGSRCKLVEWPGFRHELHNETERGAVFAVIRQWLGEKVEEFNRD
ncbi:alpha/beta hydrolase [Cohnella thailandensis]|uniref:Lysophospholipase n=1 Tax=Cohnella thailandensis TaxID=557557 RepID=A0A841SSN9_9BACL|nr:alpha/beta hydrolase [Cohnella thailandensis]MBB6633606.1 lysophospholipase [Cohnella thailandensis]MBP1976390.1 alpha-beta hydrolase superfamily lysophospholipase [Cohnella thailandensis]